MWVTILPLFVVPAKLYPPVRLVPKAASIMSLPSLPLATIQSAPHSASGQVSTPLRPPSHTVREISALTTGKKHILVKMERMSTGGTRRGAQFKRAAQGPMSAAARKRKERLRASLFPKHQAAARKVHKIQTGKVRARFRAKMELQKVEKDIKYFVSRVAFCDTARWMLKSIRDSTQVYSSMSWIEANLEDPIAIQRVRAQLEAGLRQASLVKNVDDDDED